MNKTKPIPAKLRRVLNKSDNWCAVGRYVESVDDRIPDMMFESIDSDELDEDSLAIEIANRLNHYPELRRAYDELQKQYIRKVVECNSLTSRLNPCTVKIG